MQDLRVTSLAVNYALVSWRVGRNRVLIGSEDGRLFEDRKAKRPKRQRDEEANHSPAVKEEARGSKLARLRERVVLYDAIIQSIESIKEFRGAMRDESFVQEVEGKRAYFHALRYLSCSFPCHPSNCSVLLILATKRCLNLAISHMLTSNHSNALALFSRASGLATKALKSIPAETENTTSSPTLHITKTQAQLLQTQLKYLVYRTQAIVDLDKYHDNSAIAVSKNMASAAPLVQRLGEFPSPGVSVDLANLVTYPPRLEPIPVKPLFFDVAWNYIDYPGRSKEIVEKEAKVNGTTEKQEQEEAPKKRGWFGFGR